MPWRLPSYLILPSQTCTKTAGDLSRKKDLQFSSYLNQFNNNKEKERKNY